MKKILLTGGGSAGHVTPNISIIEHLLSKGNQCFYIGSYHGIERQMIQDYFQGKVKYIPVCSGKFRRYFSIKNLIDPFFIILGFFQSIFQIAKIQPDIVFSKGGFVAPPVVFASKLLRKTIYIHESDSSPGLATKLTAPIADKIFVPDKLTQEKLSQKYSSVHQVDLPIREFLYHGNPSKIKFKDESKPTLLIMGGSLGAKTFNDFLLQNYNQLTKSWNIIHFTGHTDYSKMPPNGSSYIKHSFVQKELADIYAKTNLILARSGATTIQEIKLLKIPAVLVPLPKSQSRGEQIQNAKDYAKDHPAEIIKDNSLSITAFQTAAKKVKSKSFPEKKATNSILQYF